MFKKGYSKHWDIKPEKYGLKMKDVNDSKMLAKYLMLPQVAKF